MLYLWSRQESNLDPGLRRPLYYPLYYRTKPTAADRLPASRGLVREGKIKQLFQQSPQVSAEYFDGDGQQDDAKEFPGGDHTGRAQDPFNKVH